MSRELDSEASEDRAGGGMAIYSIMIPEYQLYFGITTSRGTETDNTIVRHSDAYYRSERTQ
jgi:hypothetical protein